MLSVALQTAQAIILGTKGLRVRVLFDAGSHKSFMTSRAVQSAGLRAERHEGIKINTFRQQRKDSGMSGVYELRVFPLQGGDGVKIDVSNILPRSQTSLFFEVQEHVQSTKGRGKGERRLGDLVLKMAESAMVDDYAISQSDFRPVHLAYLEQKIACPDPLCKEKPVFCQKKKWSSTSL